MSVVPIARYLAQFDRDGSAEARPRPQATAPATIQAAAAEDSARRIDEAFVRGEQAGRAAVLADCERALAQERAGFDARLERQRAIWVADEAGRMSERIDAAVLAMRDDIAGSVERILKPFLARVLRDQAVGALRGHLSALLSADGPSAVRISGPPDLLAALGAELASCGRPVECVATGDIDVRIVSDRTIIESRLQAWIAGIE